MNQAAPAVSVVVPFFRVEEWIADTLDSLLAQDFGDFEVVLVDDGSPDGSRAIAQQYVDRDPRFRLLSQVNGGLGSARNAGLRASRGEWVTFVDSDDELPAGALAALTASARQSGSDIVVGSVVRFDSERTWIPPWVAEVHSTTRRGVRLGELPGLLRNLYTWDKLYRRDFLLAQDLWFREGVAYEDQPWVTRLLARAKIDVLPDVVYRYRDREDRSGLSQQTASLRDLRDRIVAWDESQATLRAELAPALYDEWLSTLIEHHFYWYLLREGIEDDAFWDELVDAIRRLLADSTPLTWARARPVRRVITEAARQGRRDAVRRFVARGGTRLRKWPATVRADGVLLDLPLHKDARMPQHLFLLHPDQLEVEQRLDEVAAGADGLVLTGWAYLRKVDLPPDADYRPSLLLTRADGTVTELPAEVAPPGERPPLPDRHCDYRRGRFAARVPRAVLEGPPAKLGVRVRSRGFDVSADLTHVVPHLRLPDPLSREPGGPVRLVGHAGTGGAP